MKVITRKYKLEKWKAIITNQMASGLTATEYCRQEDLPISIFFYWKRTIIDAAIIYGSFYHSGNSITDATLFSKFPPVISVILLPSFTPQTVPFTPRPLKLPSYSRYNVSW